MNEIKYRNLKYGDWSFERIERFQFLCGCVSGLGLALVLLLIFCGLVGV